MSATDTLEDWLKKWARYKTDSDTEGSDPHALTLPGSSAKARLSSGFLRDVATVIHLLLDQAARHTRALAQLRAQPAPVPLQGEGALRNEIGQLRVDHQAHQLKGYPPAWLLWALPALAAADLLGHLAHLVYALWSAP